MNVKEVERHTGMTRANIRFYEAEGLLDPQRGENGYRIYSQGDVEVLQRIRLLRTLGISLQEIKAIHREEVSLITALDQHVASLVAHQQELEVYQTVCTAMRQDGAEYRSLDAQRYLQLTTNGNRSTLEKDRLPRLHIPWRRFFARMFDVSFYHTVLMVAITLVFRCNITIFTAGVNLVMQLLALLIMLLVEPLLLCRFGTTLGKAIMGISVTNEEGGRLTYGQALERTQIVLWCGLGCSIPIYTLYRLGRSYFDEGGERDLLWEEDSALLLQDKKTFRIVVMVVGYGLSVAALVLSCAYASLPQWRGEISVGDFVSNYNQMVDFHGLGATRLRENGTWDDMGVVITVNGVEKNLPEFEYTQRDRIITAITLEVDTQEEEYLINNRYGGKTAAAILAFVGAQEERGVWDEAVVRLIEAMNENPREDFQQTLYGVEVTRHVDYAGYVGNEWLIPQTGTEHCHYRYSFSMVKE